MTSHLTRYVCQGTSCELTILGASEQLSSLCRYLNCRLFFLSTHLFTQVGSDTFASEAGLNSTAQPGPATGFFCPQPQKPLQDLRLGYVINTETESLSISQLWPLRPL